MHVRGIDHIGITTADLDRAKRFYGDVLGLTLRSEGEDGPSDHLDRLVGLPGVKIRYAEYHLGNGQILELLQYLSPEGQPLLQRTSDPGTAHLALEVDDIDGAHRALVDAGVTVRSEPVLLEEDDDWQGYRCVYALDPDGFTVEVVQRPDGEPE
jgi:catechol 2,3-dioxygenase-like lactoylglutathione lyase family enzyme